MTKKTTNNKKEKWISAIYKRILLYLVLLIFTQGTFAMELISPAFSQHSVLPTEYTCDSDGISPELHWYAFPENTKSFALVYDDPDAPNGTWTHWILYNIPTKITSLAENIQTLPAGTEEGINSWGNTGYGAACPPEGEHRYIFHLYALDTILPVDDHMTSEKLEKAMEGHILETAELSARYARGI